MIAIKIWNRLETALDYDLILINLVKVLSMIIAAMIIYVMVRIIIKRIFSITIKTRSIRLKDSIYIRKRQQTLEKLILSLWRYFIYIVTFLMILSLFGMNIQTILAGAGIVGVIFAVGSQRLLQDFVDGFFNIFEDNISVGDYVEIDKVEGTIVDIGLRAIKIKSWTGEIHIVPNSKIGHLINYSLDNGKAIVDVKVDYNVDVDRVYEILKASFETLKNGNPNIRTPLTILGVNKLDTIGYDVRISCETIKETHWSVQRYIRAELIKLFKQHQIDIGINQIIIKDNQNHLT